MSAQRWLLDSDAAACMCKYELVRDLSRAMGVTLADLCVLPQLRYQLQLNKPAKALARLGSKMAVAQAKLLIKHAAEVVVRQDSANFALLEGTPDIDGGELALFAAMLDSSDSGLLTGDKRSLVALSKMQGTIKDSVSWLRILCTEEALALLIEHFGHAYISRKVRARLDANIGLAIIFGRAAPSSVQSIDQGLRSFVLDLARKTGGSYVLRHVQEA